MTVIRAGLYEEIRRFHQTKGNVATAKAEWRKLTGKNLEQEEEILQPYFTLTNRRSNDVRATKSRKYRRLVTRPRVGDVETREIKR